jgi:hypothetical protein
MCRVFLSLGLRHYVHKFGRYQASVKSAAFAFGKGYFACYERKKRVITGAFDVFTRVNFSTALANQNHSGAYCLTVVFFYPQTLGTRIAPQPC